MTEFGGDGINQVTELGVMNKNQVTELGGDGVTVMKRESSD